MPGLLGPLRHRQHDVGQRRGLRHHDVAHDQQVERLEPLGDVGGVGRADDDVGAEDQQRRRARRACRARRAARTPTARGRAATSGVDAPHPGDVRAGGRVVDAPVAGQLVGLLPVLAAALAVALAGQAAVARAAAGRPCPSARATLIQAEHGVGARASAARRPRAVSTMTLPGLAEQRRQLAHLATRRHPGRPARRARATRRRPSAARPRPAGGARRRGSRSSTAPAATSRCSTPSASARSVPGHRLEVQVGAVRGRRPPRVDRRRPCRRARAAGRGGGAAGGMVSARLEPTSTSTSASSTSASGNGSPRSMPNARIAGGGGRRHAAPAVVVDLRGAERDPGELAQRVGLLVGQPAAAEHARPRPVRARAPGRRGCRSATWSSASSHVTGRQLAGRAVAHQRRGEPLAGAEQPGRASSPCGTARPRLTGNSAHGSTPRASPSATEPHAALQGAVRAVGGHGRCRWSSSCVRRPPRRGWAAGPPDRTPR